MDYLIIDTRTKMIIGKYKFNKDLNHKLKGRTITHFAFVLLARKYSLVIP